MSMKRSILLTAATVTTLALTACGRSHTTINLSDGNIMLHDGYVTIHADNAQTATVSADGDLRIGSRTITVNTRQRQLLRSYYVDANHVGRQALAIGKAGVDMAGNTIGDVFSNLVSGHPDRIDSDVNKRADGMLAKASAICDGLHALQVTQDALGSQLDVFKPYARLQGTDVDKCHADITKARNETARHAD